MLRQSLTCGDLKRRCEMRTEYRTIYHSPDGKVFHVQRQGCRNCGHQRMTAIDVTVVKPNLPWFSHGTGDDGLEVYEDGELWEGC